jgi:hypothetical protein
MTISFSFLQNKYSTWYFNIIQTAVNRNLHSRKMAKSALGYVEQHHIIPLSLGGQNTKNNVIFLTAREHFVCHRLLTKMVTGAFLYKMLKAISRMLDSNKFQNRHCVSARQFEQIRREAGVAHAMLIKGTTAGELNPHFGKKHTDATKLKMSIDRRGKNLGVKKSVEFSAALSKRFIGVPKTQQHKSAMIAGWNKTRELRVGENHPMFGKTHAESSKEKMKASSAKRWTPEAKAAASIKKKEFYRLAKLKETNNGQT